MRGHIPGTYSQVTYGILRQPLGAVERTVMKIPPIAGQNDHAERP